MEKINRIAIGIITGILAPLLTFFITYAVKYKYLTISAFISNLVELNAFSQLLSLCVIPNLLAFFIFIWLNLLKSARGVLFATIVLTVIIIGIKVVF